MNDLYKKIKKAIEVAENDPYFQINNSENRYAWLVGYITGDFTLEQKQEIIDWVTCKKDLN